MKPKKHKEFKKGIAQEIGVHQNVVDDFIKFYYDKVRDGLSTLGYPRVYVDCLGTFVVRKGRLDKSIKRNKDILGNISKQTYKGYEKSVIVAEKLKNMERVQADYEQIFKEKAAFKQKKNGSK